MDDEWALGGRTSLFVVLEGYRMAAGLNVSQLDTIIGLGRATVNNGRATSLPVDGVLNDHRLASGQTPICVRR